MASVNLKEYERLTPVVHVEVEGRRIAYYTPTTFVAWRAQSLLTKEPSTIEWLNGMQPGEKLLDIGANVGGYSIYAAKMRGVHVSAIEPEAQNFHILCMNVRLNRLSDLVVCWPLGLSDEVRYSTLYISDMRAGGSCHSLGEQVDFKLRPKADFPLRQGVFSTTVDRLVDEGAIASPDHIKLDVDGLEHKVIAGAMGVLSKGGVKSLSIELNPDIAQHAGVIRTLLELGYRFDEAQVSRARRPDGPFVNFAEHVFHRVA